MAEARDRSEVAGAPVLLRLYAELTHRDPWLHLDRAGDLRAAWHDGRTGECWAALGAVCTFVAEGDQRFAALAEASGSVLGDALTAAAEADVAVPEDLPAFVGGFAFNPCAPQDIWAGWPAAEITAPEVLIHRDRNGRCGALLQRQIRAGDDPQRIARELAAAMAALAAVPAPVEPLFPDGLEGAVDAWPQETFAHWCERVYAARGAVNSGAVDKVVLARAVRLEPRAGATLSALATIRELRRRNPGAVTFAFGRPGGGVFLGATPETLARVRRHRVETIALAGTAPRGATPEEDAAFGRALVDSRKESIEHHAVVEALTGGLGALCTSFEHTPHPELRRLTDVQHLETAMSGVLRETCGVLPVVEALHPTPAVGGAPRAEALRWLQREEPLERGWYAGPIGWIDGDGDGHFAVAIRSGLIRDREGTAYVGAGIVGGSQPKGEWRETDLKLRTLAASMVAVEERP